MSIPRRSGDAFWPGSGPSAGVRRPPAPQPSETHPPLPSLNEGLKHNIFPPSNPRSRRDAQLCGLGSFTAVSGAVSDPAEAQEHEEARSLLVLWSLAVINSGSGGWCPGPWQEPSPGGSAQPPASSQQAVPVTYLLPLSTDPIPAPGGSLGMLPPGSPCAGRRERRMLAGCPGREEGRASPRRARREQHNLPLRGFAVGERRGLAGSRRHRPGAALPPPGRGRAKGGLRRSPQPRPPFCALP